MGTAALKRVSLVSSIAFLQSVRMEQSDLCLHYFNFCNFGSCIYRTWGFQISKNNINNVIFLQLLIGSTRDPSPRRGSSWYYGGIYFVTMLKRLKAEIDFFRLTFKVINITCS